jgi:hypothetical protein
MNTNTQVIEQTQKEHLRLWPGIVIVILQWFVRFVIPAFIPEATAIGIFGGLIGGLAIVIWWLGFSRAPRVERWMAVALMLVALVVTKQLVHKSIETAMMGMMFMFYSIPVLSLFFVVWAAARGLLPAGLRRITMAGTILLASGLWVILRTDGMDGQAHQNFALRWAKTAEERLLEKESDVLKPTPVDLAALKTEV